MPFLKSRTYLDAKREKAVAADSPDAAFLLGAEGDEVSAEDAERYGAETSDEAPEIVDAVDEVASGPDDKRTPAERFAARSGRAATPATPATPASASRARGTKAGDTEA